MHLRAQTAEASSPAPRSSHPRLLISDDELTEIQRRIEQDAFEKAWFLELRQRSDDLLSTEPDAYRILGGEKSLLTVSRDMEDRILTLAGMYRLTRDSRYAKRAIQEMLAAASFPDWNPVHFLDTAELTAALGIGYDWLYPVLTPGERATVKRAIVAKGIAPWLARVRANQVQYKNNWAQVCNGGETVGALAIADPQIPEDMAQLAEVLNHAREAMRVIMKLFAPDGGFEEGPVYWNYATAYNVLYLAALDSSLGTDFNAAQTLGFSETGNYRIQSIGPNLMYANFGDAHEAAFPSPQMFWFARRFNKPGYAVAERRLMVALRGKMSDATARESRRFSMLGLCWSALESVPSTAPEPPLAFAFSRINQAFMRSSWTDPGAWFLGAKGGDARASHGHLDLGSFVLDALGQRWAVDLGPDSYGLPGYFGEGRWNYYRTRTEGHNTLTVNGRNQALDAKAPLLRIGDAANAPFAIVDLTGAYPEQLSTWRRGFSLIAGNGAILQDEIRPRSPIDLVWHLHTFAGVALSADGRTATLSQDGQSMDLRILSPANVKFEARRVSVPPPQQSSTGVTDLVIQQKQLAGNEILSVLFIEAGTLPRIAERRLRSLEDW